MKNLALLFTISILIIGLNSCITDRSEYDTAQTDQNSIIRTQLPSSEMSTEELNDLANAGFAGGVVEVFEVFNPATNETNTEYRIDGDCFLSKDQIGLQSKLHEENVSRQYRTNIVVQTGTGKKNRRGNGYDIYKFKVVGWSLDAYPNIKAGLIQAAQAYNALPLGFDFVVEFRQGNGYVDDFSTINLYAVNPGNSSAAGGKAGFPKYYPMPRGGISRPPVRLHDRIEIYVGTDDLGTKTCKHVVAHELGHCLGMRHTDYFDRRLSCGAFERNPDEGQTEYGAIHIPGTPSNTNTDRQSIFNSCFSSSATGNFSSQDITALMNTFRGQHVVGSRD